MSEKIKNALGWLMIVLAVVLVLNWLLTLITGKANKTEIQRARADTDEKLNLLRKDFTATIKAVREENHQIARATLDELRIKTALPARTKPKGTAGFASTEPEAI